MLDLVEEGHTLETQQGSHLDLIVNQLLEVTHIFQRQKFVNPVKDQSGKIQFFVVWRQLLEIFFGQKQQIIQPAEQPLLLLLWGSGDANEYLVEGLMKGSDSSPDLGVNSSFLEVSKTYGQQIDGPVGLAHCANGQPQPHALRQRLRREELFVGAVRMGFRQVKVGAHEQHNGDY